MTPAVDAAKHAKTPFKLHEYKHDPSTESYGLEAADKLNIDPARVFKTLVVSFDGNKLGVAVVSVSNQLNLKRYAKAIGSKKAEMAEKKLVERTTGYLLGGVSPIGQKKRLVTVIDITAQEFETIFVSAGRRGLEIELAPNDLCALTNAKFEAIGQ